jgi:hypothetical protein
MTAYIDQENIAVKMVCYLNDISIKKQKSGNIESV